jgi:site-specific recombinase XerD
MLDKVQEGKAESTINNTLCAAVADHFRFSDSHPTRSEVVSLAKRVVRQNTPPPKRRKRPPATIFRDLVIHLFTNPGQGRAYLVKLRDYCMILQTYLVTSRPEATVRLLAEDVTKQTLGEPGELQKVRQVILRDGKTNRGGEPHVSLIDANDGGDPPRNYSWWLDLYEQVERDWRASLGRQRPKTMFYNLTAKQFGKELSPKTITSRLRKYLKEASLDGSGITAYSLRAMAVSDAVRKQVSMHLIQRHGNWKSAAVYRYVYDDPSEQLEVSRALRSP